MIALLGTLVVLTGCQAGADQEVIAPGKFIPTLAVKFSSTKGWLPAEEAARFDLIVVSWGSGHATVHSSEHGNTWQTLKHFNPNLIVFIHHSGPAIYNASGWGNLGEGWDWVTEHHGIGSEDRWTAVGAQYGGYLQGRAYPVERLMNLGNRNWQEFWVKETYAKSWSGEDPPGEGADGICSDNSFYSMPGVGAWHLEGHPDQPDGATDYYRNGEYDNELYKPHMKQFLAFAVPWFEERGLKFVVNFGNMVRRPEDWAELDASPHPPFAANEEGAFFHPWGTLARQGNLVFWSEEQWLNQINAMRGLKHVRALMQMQAVRLLYEAEGLSRMDAVDASGIRVWDALWYGISSFLQGFDTERQNAYMSFSVGDSDWVLGGYYFHDEFDPQYLHLGSARGEFTRLDGAQGYVYAREFDDGWAMVNPTGQDAMGVPVPGGDQARLLNHDNFKQAEAQPLVSQFDLPVHRGVILLKAGRQVGNQDNH